MSQPIVMSSQESKPSLWNIRSWHVKSWLKPWSATASAPTPAAPESKINRLTVVSVDSDATPAAESVKCSRAKAYFHNLGTSLKVAGCALINKKPGDLAKNRPAVSEARMRPINVVECNCGSERCMAENMRLRTRRH